MKIQCENSDCGARFEVNDKYAGRRIKCPKCSSPIAIPQLEAARESQPSGAAPLPPVVPSGGALPQIQIGATGAEGVSVSAQKRGPSRKPGAGKQTSRLGMMIAAGALVVGVLAVAGFFLFSPSDETPALPTEIGPVANVSGQGTSESESETPSSSATFEIQWREADRSGGVVFIDGIKKTVPASGPVAFTLAAGNHKVRMMRRGYEPLEMNVSLEGGESSEYTPLWKKSEIAWDSQDQPSDFEMPEPIIDEGLTFDDWLQDFETAKQLAVGQGKDVLIAFSGSDWCGWCQRMASDTFLQPNFRERMEQDFVLVYMNLPRYPEDQSKVEDLARNAHLKTHYSVNGFPTVLLTDSSGRPIGVIPGYVPGGVDGFASQLDQWQVVGSQLKTLFNRIEIAQTDEIKSEVITETVALLTGRKLLPYYRHLMGDWISIVRATREVAEPPVDGNGLDNEVAGNPDDRPATSPDATETPDPVSVEADPIPTEYDDPETFLADQGLKKLNGYFLLPEESEISKMVREADSIKRKVFLEQKKVTLAQDLVDKKEQAIQAYLQQTLVLRERLPLAGTVEMHNQIITAINQLKTRAVMLARSQKEENALKDVRAGANSAMEIYVENILESRKLLDLTEERYRMLLASATIAAAVEEFNGTSETSYKMGPSTSFNITIRKLKGMEETVLSDSIDLRRGPGNLWYVSVMMNKTKAVEMIVDTGASAISLPWSVAVSVGLDPSSSDRGVLVSLADGSVVEGKLVTAPTVRIGKFTAENVECIVMPASMRDAEPLLGQSFFQHFNCKVDTAAGKLILSKIE